MKFDQLKMLQADTNMMCGYHWNDSEDMKPFVIRAAWEIDFLIWANTHQATNKAS